MNATRLTESFADMARVLYLRDGFCAPIVQVTGGVASMSALPPAGDLRMHVPQLAATLVWAARARYVTLIAEAWRQERDRGDGIPERGELAILAERDPTVQTVILVSTWEVSNARRGAEITTRPIVAEDGRVRWGTTIHERAPRGEMADLVRRALNNPIVMPHPDPAHLELIAELIVDEGGATEACVLAN